MRLNPSEFPLHLTFQILPIDQPHQDKRRIQVTPVLHVLSPLLHVSLFANLLLKPFQNGPSGLPGWLDGRDVVSRLL